jgi:uncharacterized protein YwqG
MVVESFPLRDKTLNRISDQIESIAKKSIRMSTGKVSAANTNRLGGCPNLPKDFDWPTWREEPLAFVAQLDLATLPRVSDLPLPRTGALFFFFEGGENTWGFSPEDQGSSCVLYSPAPLSSSMLRSLPKGLDEHLRFKGVRLSPQLELTLPGLQDQALEGLGMKPDEREAYFNFLMGLQERETERIHRIGGYPDCVQGDPKLEAHLVSHGLYCGDRTGYQVGKKRGLWPGAKDWELLLQVDSDDRAKMMWGDVGRIYFLIQRSALEQRQFEKTWLVFQCS